MTKGM